MDQQLINILVELFGDGPYVEITSQELRDAISIYPRIPADTLLAKYQSLIRELLKRDVWFQLWSHQRIKLWRLSATFVTKEPPRARLTDFQLALAYANGKDGFIPFVERVVW